MIIFNCFTFSSHHALALVAWNNGKGECQGNKVEAAVSALPLPGAQLGGSGVVTTWSVHKWSTTLVKAAMLLGHGVEPSRSIIEYYQ